MNLVLFTQLAAVLVVLLYVKLLITNSVLPKLNDFVNVIELNNSSYRALIW